MNEIIKEKELLSIYEDNGALVRFLGDLLRKGTLFVRHFDSQLNILISISSALFVFSFSSVSDSNYKLSFIVLGAFAALAALAGLLGVHPPRFLRKRGQSESIMYNKKICDFSSPEEYGKALIEVAWNKELLVNEYATEVYNLYNYYYRPKRKLFKVSQSLLMIGIGLSLLTMVTGL
jgi:hypothetical protein